MHCVNCSCSLHPAQSCGPPSGTVFFLCFFDINLHPWAFLQFPYYGVCRHCSFSSLWLKAQAPGDAWLAVWNGAGREPKREAKREKQGENWSRGRRSSVTKILKEKHTGAEKPTRDPQPNRIPFSKSRI